MARLARAEIFDPSEIVAVHLIGKTVRSCYLMGFDERSGTNFDHRKRGIEEKKCGVPNICDPIFATLGVSNDPPR